MRTLIAASLLAAWCGTAYGEAFDGPGFVASDFGLLAGYRSKEAYPVTDGDRFSGSIYTDFGAKGLYLDFGFDARPLGSDASPENIPIDPSDPTGPSWPASPYGGGAVYIAQMREIRSGLLLAPQFQGTDGLVIEPYVGAGRDFFRPHMYTNFDSETTSDEAWGFYFRGGVRFRASNAEVGLDFRGLRAANVTLFGRPETANYDQVSVFIGFHFGK